MSHSKMNNTEMLTNQNITSVFLQIKIRIKLKLKSIHISYSISNEVKYFFLTSEPINIELK